MTFQEFVDNYFGWHIDLCELTVEDEMMLLALYEEER